MKKIIIIVAAVLLVACIGIIAVAAIGGLGMTQPAADTAEAFMNALQQGNYAAAYALCAPALQQELGSADGLRAMIEKGQVKPTKWNFNSREVANNQGEVKGNVTFDDNRAGVVSIVLLNSGGAWQVVGFNLAPA